MLLCLTYSSPPFVSPPCAHPCSTPLVPRLYQLEGYYPQSSNVLRMLGYFSLAGLARVHCLVGDYVTALQVRSGCIAIAAAHRVPAECVRRAPPGLGDRVSELQGKEGAGVADGISPPNAAKRGAWVLLADWPGRHKVQVSAAQLCRQRKARAWTNLAMR